MEKNISQLQTIQIEKKNHVYISGVSTHLMPQPRAGCNADFIILLLNIHLT